MATKSINQHDPATVSSANDYNVLVQGISAIQHKKINAGNLSIGIVANQYSNTQTYALNDKVIHDGVLYKCTTAITTAEEWNSAHWTATLAVNEGGGGSTEDCLKNKGTQIINYDGTTPSKLILKDNSSTPQNVIEIDGTTDSPKIKIGNVNHTDNSIEIYEDDILKLEIGVDGFPWIQLKTNSDNIMNMFVNKINGYIGGESFEILYSDLYNLITRKGGYPLTTSDSGTVTLNPNEAKRITTAVTDVVLNFANPIADTDNEYKVYFTTGTGTLTFTPNYPTSYTCKGDTVTLSANKTYEISYAVIGANLLGCVVKEYS